MERPDAVQLTDRLHAEQGKGDPFAAAVRATRMPMIITDPRQDDNPIVFANEAFLRLTGYGRNEIMGRNCRFLQGPDTDQEQVAKVRQAVEERLDVDVEILNYRRDGTPFWNALYLSPVFGESGELQFFFASQFDVTDRKDRELQALDAKAFFEKAVHERTAELEAALAQTTVLLHEVDHRVKNNLQMVAAMIRNQARFSPSPDVKSALAVAMARVETLGAVHRRLYQSTDISEFKLDEFIREIASDMIEASGRADVRLELDLRPLVVSAAIASPLALLINEVITNALKHAFPGGRAGVLRIATRNDGDLAKIVVTDDGVGLPASQEGKNTFGQRLIDSLVRQIRGTISTASDGPGARVAIQFHGDDGGA